MRLLLEEVPEDLFFLRIVLTNSFTAHLEEARVVESSP